MLLLSVLVLLISVWLVWFVMQIIQNVSLIRAGKPTSMEQRQRKQLEASITSQMANTKVSSADLARMEEGAYPVYGNPKAPFHLVVFIDYECPYSKQVAPVLRDVMRTHADDLYVVVRDFPITEIHPDAERSAIAANCVFALGGREAYWNYFDRLFVTQGSHGAAQLRSLALQSGITDIQFDRCASDATRLQQAQRSFQEGLNVGVAGTPTFFINGYRIQGAMDATAFDIAIDQARQKSAKP